MSDLKPGEATEGLDAMVRRIAHDVCREYLGAVLGRAVGLPAASDADRGFLDGVLVSAGYVQDILGLQAPANALREARRTLLADFRVCTDDLPRGKTSEASRAVKSPAVGPSATADKSADDVATSSRAEAPKSPALSTEPAKCEDCGWTGHSTEQVLHCIAVRKGRISHGKLEHHDSGHRGASQQELPEGREQDGGGVRQATASSGAHGDVREHHIRSGGTDHASEQRQHGSARLSGQEGSHRGREPGDRGRDGIEPTRPSAKGAAETMPETWWISVRPDPHTQSAVALPRPRDCGPPADSGWVEVVRADVSAQRVAEARHEERLTHDRRERPEALKALGAQSSETVFDAARRVMGEKDMWKAQALDWQGRAELKEADNEALRKRVEELSSYEPHALLERAETAERELAETRAKLETAEDRLRIAQDWVVRVRLATATESGVGLDYTKGKGVES